MPVGADEMSTAQVLPTGSERSIPSNLYVHVPQTLMAKIATLLTTYCWCMVHTYFDCNEILERF